MHQTQVKRKAVKMIRLSIILIFIFSLHKLNAQTREYDEVSAMKLYAAMFEAEKIDDQQFFPKGITLDTSLNKYFLEIIKPSGFRNLDSLISSPCWSYIKQFNSVQFIAKNKHIKQRKLLNHFINRPSKIKIIDYFCDLSPVMFSEDMKRGCFFAKRTQRGIMIYFYEMKDLNWTLVKAETLYLF
jgi:hypothetical protein